MAMCLVLELVYIWTTFKIKIFFTCTYAPSNAHFYPTGGAKVRIIKIFKICIFFRISTIFVKLLQFGYILKRYVCIWCDYLYTFCFLWKDIQCKQLSAHFCSSLLYNLHFFRWFFFCFLFFYNFNKLSSKHEEYLLSSIVIFLECTRMANCFRDYSRFEMSVSKRLLSEK